MRHGAGRTFTRWLVALLFFASGVMHFVATPEYASIIPSVLPAAVLLVQISGVAELLGGLALLVPGLRRWASYGLVALLVAVFPANLNMAHHDLPVNGHHVPMALLWLRLPLQLVFIWVTWWCGGP